MYASKIFLVGTEAGLGVRNAGVLGATAGDVVLTSAGKLTHSGTIHANGNSSVTAQGDVTISGRITAQGDTTVLAQGSDHTDAGAGAGAQIHASAASALASGVSATGVVSTHGDLVVQSTGNSALRGQLLSGGSTDVRAAQLNADDANVQGQNIRFTATAGDISTRDARITTPGTLTVHTPTKLAQVTQPTDPTVVKPTPGWNNRSSAPANTLPVMFRRVFSISASAILTTTADKSCKPVTQTVTFGRQKRSSTSVA